MYIKVECKFKKGKRTHNIQYKNHSELILAKITLYIGSPLLFLIPKVLDRMLKELRLSFMFIFNDPALFAFLMTI